MIVVTNQHTNIRQQHKNKNLCVQLASHPEFLDDEIVLKLYYIDWIWDSWCVDGGENWIIVRIFYSGVVTLIDSSEFPDPKNTKEPNYAILLSCNEFESSFNLFALLFPFFTRLYLAVFLTWTKWVSSIICWFGSSLTEFLQYGSWSVG